MFNDSHEASLYMEAAQILDLDDKDIERVLYCKYDSFGHLKKTSDMGQRHENVQKLIKEMNDYPRLKAELMPAIEFMYFKMLTPRFK